FEIGSGFGYSALWFLEAGCKVYLSEYAEENLKIAKKYIEKSGHIKKAVFIKGDGIQNLKKLKIQPDIVFIDCEKSRYIEAFDVADKKLNKRGVIIADNALWKGRVLNNEENVDEAIIGIKKFLNTVFSNNNYFSVLLPIRDGVTISFKK
ncbi:MAG: class I SAM-dependent methyltransferase, partial [bacterium]|nr:class I SAM-dependent methyltransferase [bacterium]